MLGLTRLTGRRSKTDKVAAPQPAGQCFIFRFEDPKASQLALKTMAASFDYLNKLAKYQGECGLSLILQCLIHLILPGQRRQQPARRHTLSCIR